MKSIYGLGTQQFLKIQADFGLKPNINNISEIMNNIFRYPQKAFEFKPHISQKFIQHLKTNYNHNLPKIIKEQIATDGTKKFLLEVSKGTAVETVLLPFKKNYTLCVSSQIGCAMNCSFCHTATQGLKGHLTHEQIITQYMLALSRKNDSRPITNIVFMGQGEPLHNFENLKMAIDVLSDPNGISISRQKITVSTSGYLPGIERFNELNGVNFALSLHSTNESIRSELIPINKKYPLKKIDPVIQNIKLEEKQFIEYEYLLIQDLNDSENDAKNLASFIKGKKAILNIIPYNEFVGSPYKRPLKPTQDKFISIMVEHGIRTMLRGTKGDEIMAACGQLKS